MSGPPEFGASPLDEGDLFSTDPADVAELNALGDRHARAGNFEEARLCFERTARAYREAHFLGKALAVYKKLERLDPSNINTKLSLAELSVGLMRRREACLYFEGAIELDRRALTSKRSVSILKGICDLSPGDTTLRTELARTCERGGFRLEAHEAHLAVARVLRESGQHAAAEAAFHSALENNPFSRPALEELAEMMIDTGRGAEAVGLLEGVVAHNPLDLDLRLLLGQTCLLADRLEDAERAFVRLVEIDPNKARYLLEVGSRYAANGELDGALRIASVASERAPGSQGVEAVAALLERVVAEDPERDDAIERLAFLYEQTGNSVGAVGALESLLARAVARGEQDQVPMLLARLSRLAPDHKVPPAPAVERPLSAPVEIAPVPPEEIPSTQGQAVPGASEGTASAGAELVLVDEAPVQTRASIAEIVQAVSAYAEGRGLDLAVAPDKPAPPAPEPARNPAPSDEPGFANWLLRMRQHDERDWREAPRVAPPTIEPMAEGSPRRAADLYAGAVVVRGFDTCLESEWRRAARMLTQVSLLRIRVSRAQSTSDSGSRAWSAAVAETLEEALDRPGDLLAACDIGDYVAVLPGTPREGAVTVARRMSAALFGSDRHAADRVAIGIASAMPERGSDKKLIIIAAERALAAAGESTDRLSIASEHA